MNQAAPLDLVDHISTFADTGNSYAAYPLLDALRADPRPEAQSLAVRMVRHLGGNRLSDAIGLRLWRKHPNHPEAMVVYARILADRKGPYRGWRWMESACIPDDAPPAVLAEWHASRATLAGALRDWETATSLFSAALSLASEDPWIHVLQAHVFERQDRYDEAIAACLEALRLYPSHRAAIQGLAHLHTLTGNDAEAIRLLQTASANMQSADVEAQLFGLLSEHRHFDEAAAALTRCRTYTPLADKGWRRWLDAQEVDNLLARKQFDEAAHRCGALNEPFYVDIRARLAEPASNTDLQRVQLDVGFVRQHHLTCAPATLSALSHYWGYAAEHLEIAEQICYDGTPASSERAWAERNGFFVQEFTVDWPVTRALIDAGVPFTLTTEFTNAGHLQAVIGYDALRGTLLIRDPSQRIYAEHYAVTLFSQHRASGPRGMLMVPSKERHRLNGITLPDAADWDSYYTIIRALEAHNRGAADAAAQAQQSRAPDHWLTLRGLRALAHYDGDLTRALALTDQSIEHFGDHPSLLLHRQQLLATIGTRREALDAAQAAVAKHPWNPPLLTRLSRLLSDDARQIPEAIDYASRALRVNINESEAWRAMADALWLSGDKADALVHYRIAACLHPHSEDLAITYCQACFGLGKMDQGLAFLQARIDQLGGQSSAPSISAFGQFDMLGRTNEAFALLENALQQRPNDETLRLFYAEKALAYAQPEKARALLAGRTGQARHAEQLRVEALIARHEGRIDDAWVAVSAACEREPLHIPLRRMAADIRAQQSGRAAAVQFLKDACAQHPTYLALYEALLEWMAEAPATESEAIIRQALALHPHYAFMQRELANNLASQRKLEDAWSVAREAQALAPRHASTYAMLGGLYLTAGDVHEAQQQFREALLLNIDHGYALHRLVTTCNSHQARREALAFIASQLEEQSTQGDPIFTYQVLARHTLPDDELEGELRALHTRRPELWQTWAALAVQLIDTNQFAAAQTLLDGAIDRFPLMPRLHYELARLATNQGDFPRARTTVQRALQLSPSWTWALRLAVHLAMNEPGQLEAGLALVAAPRSRCEENPEGHVLRARLLWKLDRRDEALAQVETALHRWPAHTEAWDFFIDAARQMERAHYVAEFTAELARQRPDNIDVLIRQADHAATLDDALAAVDKATAINPLHQPAYIARINALNRHGRFAEALETVHSTPWGQHTPTAILRCGPRLHWQHGDTDKAITALQQLLKSEVNSFDMWRELADWTFSAKRHDECLAAAREMVRIDSTVAVGYGYLGHGLRERGETASAIEALRTAFELDPFYVYAGLALTDLLLASDWNAAKQVLVTLRANVPGPAVALREIQYAVRAGDKEGAAAPLAEIVRVSEHDAGTFDKAVEALPRGSWRELLFQATEQASLCGEVSEAAARYWLEREFDVAHPAFLDKVEPYLKADHHQRFKIAVINCATAVRMFQHVSALVAQYSREMRANAECWALVGYAYLEAKRFQEVVDWMHDWQRADAPWWALDNLAVALRTDGRHGLANQVSEMSHGKEPRSPDAMVWLACDAARHGQTRTLLAWLERVRPMKMRPYYQGLHQVLEGYCAAATTGKAAPLRTALRQWEFASRKQSTLADLMVDVRRRWIQDAPTSWERFSRVLRLI